jgi:predicted XRE-type DNA-binding protein
MPKRGVPVSSAGETDEVLVAMAEVLATLRAIAVTADRIEDRVAMLRRRRAEGAEWGDLVGDEQRPLIVELLSAGQERLVRSGSKLRRAQAQALRAEGLTYDRIAELFGVTRQRVIALVKAADAANTSEAGGSGGER